MSREIAPLVGAKPDLAAEAARIVKADLASEMVYEFPELQGLMGGYYAEKEGLPQAVSDAVRDGEQALEPVPERRPPGGPTASAEEDHDEELVGFTRSGIPVWRCKVCGYLCARPQPPLKCPICKADKDRFERFA